MISQTVTRTYTEPKPSHQYLHLYLYNGQLLLGHRPICWSIPVSQVFQNKTEKTDCVKKIRSGRALGGFFRLGSIGFSTYRNLLQWRSSLAMKVFRQGLLQCLLVSCSNCLPYARWRHFFRLLGGSASCSARDCAPLWGPQQLSPVECVASRRHCEGTCRLQSCLLLLDGRIGLVDPAFLAFPHMASSVALV